MHRNTSLPIDGRGGLLWKVPILLPYWEGDADGNPPYLESSMNFTWSQMDYYTVQNYERCVLYGTCFGLVFMTLIQVMALTPSTKRGLPLYTFTLLAITSELLRLVCEMVLYSRSGFGSVYYAFTESAETTQFVASTIAMLILCAIGACFTFLFASLCFFIQAKAVLGALKVTRPLWYKVIFAWLIGVGIFTFLWRVMYAVWQSVNNAGFGWQAPLWIWRTCDVTYAVSIGSWSLVFSVQVALVLYNRARLGGSLQRTEALNILLLTGLESMILPLALCILELSTVNWLPEPEILIMPCVVIILPFGSLWAGSMQAYDKRSHTFTRSNLNELQASDDIDTPADRSATPMPTVAAGQPTSSGVSVSNVSINSRSKGSRTPTSPTDPNRPMGILERDLIDDDTELEERGNSTFRKNYTYPAPYPSRVPTRSPAPGHGEPEFPAEQI